MSAAVEKYISIVEGAPGVKEATIHCVSDDPPGDAVQSRDKIISQFLAAKLSKKKQEKILQSANDPVLEQEIRDVMEIIARHQVTQYAGTDIDSRYTLMFRCCHEPDCPHPLCKKGAPVGWDQQRWYPDGPLLTFLPFPALDKNNPGHHLDVDIVWTAISRRGRDDVSEVTQLPRAPMVIVEEAVKRSSPDEDGLK